MEEKKREIIVKPKSQAALVLSPDIRKGDVILRAASDGPFGECCVSSVANGLPGSAVGVTISAVRPFGHSDFLREDDIPQDFRVMMLGKSAVQVVLGTWHYGGSAGYFSEPWTYESQGPNSRASYRITDCTDDTIAYDEPHEEIALPPDLMAHAVRCVNVMEGKEPAYLRSLLLEIKSALEAGDEYNRGNRDRMFFAFMKFLRAEPFTPASPLPEIR